MSLRDMEFEVTKFKDNINLKNHNVAATVLDKPEVIQEKCYVP